jgi:hypothetical protein
MSNSASNFVSFLKKNKVSDTGISILVEEEFSEDILRDIAANKMNDELREIRVPKGDSIRLRTWRKSLNGNSKTRSNRNRNSRARSASRTRSASRARSASRGKSRSRQAELPETPPMRRQTSVSEDLLTELAKAGTRKLMDTLMEEGTKDIIYEGKPLHLYRKNNFSSDLKRDKRSIYYTWLLPDGSEAFHLTLNHTENERHVNRSGYNRNINGAFHLKLITKEKPIRRILVNLIKDVYEITICDNKNEEIDRIANIILPIIAQYYQETERKGVVVEGSC